MKNMTHLEELLARGILDASMHPVLESDSDWAESLMALVYKANITEVLEPKLIVLIRLCIDVSATHLYEAGVKRHIQEALRLGVNQAEILEVFKLVSIVGIHSCALGVPLLKNELAHANITEQVDVSQKSTPICEEMKRQGNFNPLWETLYEWDPAYLEDFLKMATHVWKTGILPPLWIELLCIAGDAAISHMWAPGTQRHIQAALALGATQAQIIAVLKIVSLQGLESCELGGAVLMNLLKKNESL